LRIAIIGGSGKIGKWFSRFLLADNKEVVISGRNKGKLAETGRQLGAAVAADNVEAVKNADAVILSIPVENLESVVSEISPHIHTGQIIIDVTSTKVLPMEIMHRHLKQCTVLGTHPLFGPGASSLANQNIVLTPTSDEEKALAVKVKNYLEKHGGVISIMTPQEHDKKMSVVLALSHFIAIVSADTLVASSGVERTESIGGITYKVLLTLVESVLSEDPELYASLQMNLPGTVELEEMFREKVVLWAEVVRNGDRQEFIQRMTGLREKLEEGKPDFGQSYKNMYRLVEGL